jgi:hypothetical protein
MVTSHAQVGDTDVVGSDCSFSLCDRVAIGVLYVAGVIDRSRDGTDF